MKMRELTESERTERFIAWFFTLVVAISILQMFVGCKHNIKIDHPKLQNVEAKIPLGVLLGCSRHQEGFTKNQCGKMWYWEIKIND